MTITAVIPQLRTTNMASSVGFYTEKLGFTVAFNYQDFYVGLKVGGYLVHLKHVDKKDPSIPYVDEGGHLHLYIEIERIDEFVEQLKGRGVPLVKDLHETAWNTREFVIYDDQGHTLYFGEQLAND